jgi:hypothetical protein
MSKVPLYGECAAFDSPIGTRAPISSSTISDRRKRIFVGSLITLHPWVSMVTTY